LHCLIALHTEETGKEKGSLKVLLTHHKQGKIGGKEEGKEEGKK